MKTLIASFLLAMVLSTYIQAIPIDPDSATISTISQSNLTGRDAGFCAPTSEYHQWVKSGWLREDCYATFNMMRTSVLSIKDVKQTFVDIRSKSFPTKPGEVMTPKRFTVSTCTMALILVSTFERKEGKTYLPGATGYPFAAKDTSTYADIIKGVVQLEDHCLDRKGSPGWIQLGASNSLGAFFWATGSSLDLDFPGWITDRDGTDGAPTFESEPQLTS